MKTPFSYYYYISDSLAAANFKGVAGQDQDPGQQKKPTSPGSPGASDVQAEALILPHFATQAPPSIDKGAHSPNVTASIGRTAFLRCKVKNLGQKSVSEVFFVVFILYMASCHILYSGPIIWLFSNKDRT